DRRDPGLLCYRLRSYRFREEVDHENAGNDQSHAGECRQVEYLPEREVCHERDDHDADPGPECVGDADRDAPEHQAEEVKCDRVPGDGDKVRHQSCEAVRHLEGARGDDLADDREKQEYIRCAGHDGTQECPAGTLWIQDTVRMRRVPGCSMDYLALETLNTAARFPLPRNTGEPVTGIPGHRW